MTAPLLPQVAYFTTTRMVAPDKKKLIIIVSACAGVVIVISALAFTVYKLRGSGDGEVITDGAQQQQLLNQQGTNPVIIELTDLELQTLTQENFEKLLNGKATMAASPKTAAWSKLLKAENLTLEMFQKVMATPPKVNETTGEVEWDAAFTAEEKAVLGKVDKDVWAGVKADPPKPKEHGDKEGDKSGEGAKDAHQVAIDDLDDAKIDALIKAISDNKVLAVKAKAADADANAQLATDLADAVKTKGLTADILKKLVAKKYDELTDAEKATLTDLLKSAFGVPGAGPPPGPTDPPKAITVDLSGIKDADIDAAYDKLASAEANDLTIKLAADRDFTDAEKTALLTAIKANKISKPMFAQLLKGEYASLAQADKDGLEDCLKNLFNSLAKPPPPPPTGAVVNLSKLTTDDLLIKEAFNKLSSTTDVAQLSVIKTEKDGDDANLKAELVAAIKTLGLTEEIFLRMVKKELTATDYDITDKLGQHVKSQFGYVSKAEHAFDMAYGAFAPAFKAVCDKYDSNTSFGPNEMFDLEAKASAALESAKNVIVTKVSDPKKKELIEKCQKGNFLESQFFSAFWPKFEDAVKAVKAVPAAIKDMKKYWIFMGSFCSSQRNKKYGAIFEDIPEVKLRLAAFGTDAADWNKWIAIPIPDKKQVLDGLWTNVDSDVKEALLTFHDKQALFQQYFSAKPEDLKAIENCLKEAKKVHTLLKAYNDTHYLDDAVLKADHASALAAFTTFNGSCGTVSAGSGLIAPVVKAVAATPEDICAAHVANLKTAVDKFIDGTVADIVALDKPYKDATDGCPASDKPKALALFVQDSFNKKLKATSETSTLLVSADITALEDSLTRARTADATFEAGKSAKKLLFDLLYIRFVEDSTVVASVNKTSNLWNNCKLCCEDPNIIELKFSTFEEFLVKSIDPRIADALLENDDSKRKKLITETWNLIKCFKEIKPDSGKYAHLTKKRSLTSLIEFKRFAKDLPTQLANLKNVYSAPDEAAKFRIFVLNLVKASENIPDVSNLDDDAQKNLLTLLKNYNSTEPEKAIMKIVADEYLQKFTDGMKAYEGAKEADLKQYLGVLNEFSRESLPEKLRNITWDDLKDDIAFMNALKAYSADKSKANFDLLKAAHKPTDFKLEHEISPELESFIALAGDVPLMEAYFSAADDAKKQQIGVFIGELYKYAQDLKTYTGKTFNEEADATAAFTAMTAKLEDLKTKATTLVLNPAVLQTAPKPKAIVKPVVKPEEEPEPKPFGPDPKPDEAPKTCQEAQTAFAQSFTAFKADTADVNKAKAVEDYTTAAALCAGDDNNATFYGTVKQPAKEVFTQALGLAGHVKAVLQYIEADCLHGYDVGKVEKLVCKNFEDYYRVFKALSPADLDIAGFEDVYEKDVKLINALHAYKDNQQSLDDLIALITLADPTLCSKIDPKVIAALKTDELWDCYYKKTDAEFGTCKVDLLNRLNVLEVIQEKLVKEILQKKALVFIKETVETLKDPPSSKKNPAANNEFKEKLGKWHVFASRTKLISFDSILVNCWITACKGWDQDQRENYLFRVLSKLVLSSDSSVTNVEEELFKYLTTRLGNTLNKCAKLNDCILPILRHADNAELLKEALPKMLKNPEAGSPLMDYKPHYDKWVAKVEEAKLDNAFYKAFIGAKLDTLQVYSDHFDSNANALPSKATVKVFNNILDPPKKT